MNHASVSDYKINKLAFLLRECGEALVYVRADHNPFHVTAILERQWFGVELISKGRSLFIAPADIIAVWEIEPIDNSHLLSNEAGA